jgi:hypothetical protein
MRVIQASPAILVVRAEPARTNDHQHYVIGNLFVDCLDEIHAQRDGVHVHEQEVAAKLSF